MQTIVIVGGGAGGLELATRLGDTMGRKGRAKIILVDRSPTHFWKPLLHTVASGKRDPQVFQIEYSAQAAEHGFTFMHAEMRSVDRAGRTLELAPCLSDDIGAAPAARTLDYTTLVLALGAVTNFFGVPGAADNVCTLDSVRDAKSFYRRFFGACVRASEARSNGEEQQVNVMIVGGGATGVELAAELGYSARALAKYKVHSLDPARDVRISILERGPRLLPHLPPEQSARAEAYLQSRGIAVCTNAAVSSVEAETVHIAGVPHPATLTLWAAGVEGPAINTTLALQLNRMRQIMVNASLQSVEDANVFAIGDCASFVCPVKGAAPPRAQVAHQQAVFLATALARREGKPLPEFRYRDYGSLVSLGPVAAVGVLLGGSVGRQLPVSGATANLLYGLMYQKHLMALHGFLRATAVMLSDWLRKRISPSVKLH